MCVERIHKRSFGLICGRDPVNPQTPRRCKSRRAVQGTEANLPPTCIRDKTVNNLSLFMVLSNRYLFLHGQIAFVMHLNVTPGPRYYPVRAKTDKQQESRDKIAVFQVASISTEVIVGGQFE